MDFNSAQLMMRSPSTVVDSLSSTDMLHVAIGLEAVTAVWRTKRSHRGANKMGANESELAMFFEEEQRALARAGAIPCLVKLASAAPHDIQCQALTVLGFLLERNDDNQKLALELGAVSLCIELLRAVLGEGDGGDSAVATDDKKSSLQLGGDNGAAAAQPSTVGGEAGEDMEEQNLSHSRKDLIAVSAVFALGLAIGDNCESTKAALSLGLVDLIARFLSVDIGDNILALLLTLVHIMIDSDCHCTEPLLAAGGFDMLLGLRCTYANRDLREMISPTIASRFAMLAAIASDCSPRAAARYLDLGAVQAVQDVFSALVGIEDEWALRMRLNVTGLLSSLGEDAQACSFLRACLTDDDLRAICKAAADGPLPGNRGQDLLRKLLATTDVQFITRFMQTPGCLSMAIHLPSLRQAIVQATAAWNVQLLLTATPQQAQQGIESCIALAFLAPFHQRCAKALLEKGRLGVMVRSFLDSFTDGHKLHGPGPTQQASGKGECLPPRNATPKSPRSYCCVSLGEYLSHPHSEAALARSEAAEALSVITSWAPTASVKNHNGNHLPLLPEATVDASRAKRQRVEEQPLVKFLVGDVEFPCEKHFLEEKSEVLDSLIDTLGDSLCIHMQPIGSMSDESMAESLGVVVLWLRRRVMQAGVSAKQALNIWRLAEFFQLPDLSCACESIIGTGLRDKTVMREAFELAAHSDAGSAECRLRAICISYLVRNLQGCIASGVLLHLVRDHQDMLQAHLPGALATMLQEIIRGHTK